MPLSIAEYLGQRTDLEAPDILSSALDGNLVPTCPFSGVACKKLHANPPMHPVCSVRVYDQKHDGKPFIVCTDRLLPAKARTLAPTQIAALASVAKVLFPHASTADIGYDRQVGMRVGNARLVLDYILHIRPEAQYTHGPAKVILEVQGGGETSSTGTITRYVTAWADQEEPTNEFLAQKLTTQYIRTVTGQQKVNVPGIIPNNAWKRQLDQIIKKAILAQRFGGAFALIMGEVFYDYVINTIPAGGEFFSTWEVALLGIAETPSTQPGPMLIDCVASTRFMTFAAFIAALQSFNVPDDMPNPFQRTFTTLRNHHFSVD